MSVISTGVTRDDLNLVIDSEVMRKTPAGHHIDSFNGFAYGGINQIMTHLFQIEKSMTNERNTSPEDERIGQISFSVRFTNVDVGKPTITYNNNKPAPLFPTTARLRNLNYSAPITVNATITAKAFPKDGGEPEVRTEEVKNFRIATMPIMVKSRACNLHGMPAAQLIEQGEDPNELGAFFILGGGGEWVINMIETRLFNCPHIFRNIGYEREIVRLEFISKAGDAYENSYEMKMRYVTNGNIYLNFTSNNFLKLLQLPFYLLFRLLGMTTDKDIIDNIVYGYDVYDEQHRKTGEKDVVSTHMLQVLKNAMRASDPTFNEVQLVTDRGKLIDFIAHKMAHLSRKSIINDNTTAEEALARYLSHNLLGILDKVVLTHMGVTAERRGVKLRFLGNLVRKLLLVEMQIIESTDRDSLKNKRINAAGRAYAKSFKTQFNLTVVRNIKNRFVKDFKAMSFSTVMLAQSLRSAFHGPDLDKAMIQAIVTGNKDITIRNRQIPNRLASEMLHRKNQLNHIATLGVIRTPHSSASKQDTRADMMRRVHPSYTGYICMIQSADTGIQIGLVKEASIVVSVTEAGDSEYLKTVLLADEEIIPLERVTPEMLHIYNLCNVMVNEEWIGCCYNGFSIVRRYREMRRGYISAMLEKKEGQSEKQGGAKKIDVGVLSNEKFVRGPSRLESLTTICWDVNTNETQFWVDAGRLMRPLLVVRNNGELDPVGREIFGTAYDPFTNPPIEHDKNGNPVLVPGCFIQDILLTKEDVHALLTSGITIEALHKRGVVEYISPEELEDCYVAPSLDDLKANQTNPLKQYTHCEIPVVLLGMPALTSPFAQHDQPPRLCFQSNQVKQTCGWYTLNWAYRVDKHAFQQYYCETPLVPTLANKYIYPNGCNVMLAIMSYSGYNQEDSLIVNKFAMERGAFKGIHSNFVKTELEKNERFGVPNAALTPDVKTYANHSKVKSDGLPERGTILRKNDVIIGKYAEIPGEKKEYKDTSIVYSEYEPAIVDLVIKSHNQEDEEFCKVKYSNVSSATIGHKFCLTSDHEVLTRGGWLPIGLVTSEDEVATLNPEMKTLEWQHPTALSDYCHYDSLCEITSAHVRLIVTPQHSMYVRDAGDLEYRLCRADEITEGAYFRPHGAELQGAGDADEERLAAYLSNRDVRHSVEDPELQLLMGLNTAQARSLLNNVRDWEPWVTRDPVLADALQILCFLAGYSAEIIKSAERSSVELRVHPSWERERWVGADQIKKCEADRFGVTVHCLEVPNHLIYVRNSYDDVLCPCWVGNSSRAGQKGMTSMAYNQPDMPFSEEGITPTIILNPHAIPTRMTINQLIEGLVSKLAAIMGVLIDGTVFRSVDLYSIGDALEKLGFDRYGNERMYSGMSGEPVDTEIFITPCYYQRLQKFAEKELYSISTGPTCALTRQPLDGKANRGGLRIGEMERDVIISHGECRFLMVKMRDDSDGFDIYVCRNCHHMLVINEALGIRICNNCNAAGMKPSPVRIRCSYASKLFIQELESCNVGQLLFVTPYEYEI